MSDSRHDRFSTWLDKALGQPIPASVVAFCFNVAETSRGFVVELVGTPSFDAEDPDWACDDIFSSPSKFELPYAEVGRAWEPVLGIVRELTVGYIDKGSNNGEPLRAAEAVAVGFVDGDLRVVRTR